MKKIRLHACKAMFDATLHMCKLEEDDTENICKQFETGAVKSVKGKLHLV